MVLRTLRHKDAAVAWGNGINPKTSIFIRLRRVKKEVVLQKSTKRPNLGLNGWTTSSLFCQINSTLFEQSSKNVELNLTKKGDIGG